MPNGYRDYTAKILVVGDVMLDRYWTGTVERMSPEFDDVSVLRIDSESLAAGGAANVAMNARALGAAVDVVGVIGDDPEGAELSILLEQNGINIGGIVKSSRLGTTTKTRIIRRGNDGREKEKHLVRVDRDMDFDMSLVMRSRLLASLGRRMQGKDVIICSDYALGVINPEVIDCIMSHRARAGGMVIVDPKSENYLQYAGADIITPNAEEARMIIGRSFSVHIDSDCENAARDVYDRIGVPWVVLKRGEYGMMLYDGREDECYHYPVITERPLDVCGAGDTAVAMLAVALAHCSFDNVEALRLATRRANIAAGLSVRKPKTATVTMAEVDQWEHGHDSL